MPAADALADRLPDRFAHVRVAALEHVEGHRCGEPVPTRAHAQALALLTRLSRATYVLVLDGGLGYAALHMAAMLGLTGRIEFVEDDEHHTAFVEHAFAEHGFAEKLKVVGAGTRDTVPYLNGPYDLVVAHNSGHLEEEVLAALHRLLRVGGAIVVDLTGTEGLPAAVERLSADERWLTAVLEPFVVAVKLR